MGSFASEKRTVEYMIRFYCKRKHPANDLCPECRMLNDYALQRLAKCPFGDEKPACKDCRIHCYNKEMRERIKQVMRYSGPRIVLYYPFYFLCEKLNC